jgi:hypothetical protein
MKINRSKLVDIFKKYFNNEFIEKQNTPELVKAVIIEMWFNDSGTGDEKIIIKEAYNQLYLKDGYIHYEENE